jgi:hypothetical protein
MFPQKILTFYCWENVSKIYLSYRDMGHMIPKGISQTTIPNPKYIRTLEKKITNPGLRLCSSNLEM